MTMTAPIIFLPFRAMVTARKPEIFLPLPSLVLGLLMWPCLVFNVGTVNPNSGLQGRIANVLTNSELSP